MIGEKKMNKNRPLFIRSTGIWTDILPIAALLSIIMTLAGDILGELVLHSSGAFGLFNLLSGDEDISQFLAMYAVFIGSWVLFFLFAGAFKYNRPMLKCLCYSKNGNTARGALLGLLLGLVTNGFCILLSSLMGDIKLSFGGFRPVLLLAFFAVVLIQSGAEGIVCTVS